MTSASPASSPLYMLTFDGIAPSLATPPLFAGPGASVLGRARIGARVKFGPGAVIRADGHHVHIGDDFCIGGHSTVHIAHEVYPAEIGDRVSVGRNAVVHACTVGNDCVIEDHAVVLDASVVESNVLIEAGAVVYPRSTLKAGFVYAGSPAKPVRELTNEEYAQRRARVHENLAIALFAPLAIAPKLDEQHPHAFVARTAALAGDVELGARAGVLFSCVLDAGRGSIVVGDNTNVQDNTRMQCGSGTIAIGADTTIGHNVAIEDSRIGARCLIGIGSLITSGTVIGDDVLLAAGSVTEASQQIESGWLWAGRPARRISQLNESKRAMMHEIIGHYCGYGDAYRRLQSTTPQSGDRFADEVMGK